MGKKAGQSRTDGRTPRGTFQKGVSGNPKGVAKTDALPPVTPISARKDSGWANFFTGQGVLGRDKRMGGSFSAKVLTFDQLQELWRGDDLAARAVETLPKEAMRQGYDLVIAQDEDGNDNSDRTTEITEELERLGADVMIEDGLKVERGLGGSAILIGANDGQKDLTKPLNLKAVRSLDYLTLMEPREIMPIYGYADPRAPKYGQPEIYRMASRAVLPSHDGQYAPASMDIHESRLLIFPGIRVSRYQSTSMQGGWGDSVLSRMWTVLRDFNTSWSSAGVLVADFAAAVWKMKDLWETLAGDNADMFAQRLQAMDLAKSTVNMTVIDSEDEYSRQQTPISGLPDLLDRFATRLAACADMPLTLLFGTSPAGMNATGESDIRFFYDRVAAYQARRVMPQLRQLIRIIMMTTGNKKEPEKWTVRFRPLWQESAKDRASAMLTQAQADVAWVGAGILSAEEVADSHWGKGEYNPEITVDFKARDAQEQATSGPIKQEDLNALDPEHPDYAPSKLDPNHPQYKPAAPGPLDPKSPDYRPSELDPHHPEYKAPPPDDDPDPNTPPRPREGTSDHMDEFDPAQPRGNDGKWSGKDLETKAHDLLRVAHAKGGFSYSPTKGSFPTDGFMVSSFAGDGAVFNGKMGLHDESIAKFLAEKEPLFKANPNAHVGGWYDPLTDRWALDVSQKEDKLSSALALGKAHNQDAVYDLKNDDSIYLHEADDAIGGKGRFAGRHYDAASSGRNPRGVRSSQADSGADRRGDAGDPARSTRQNRFAGGLTAAGRWDYSPDEPRGADGKWGEGGAGAEAWAKANPAANTHVFSTAQAYMAQVGHAPLHVLAQQALSPEEGRGIAQSYSAAGDDPKNTDTQNAYHAFNNELAAQRAVAEKAGYKFEAWDKPGQPYANSKDMMKDVRDNKHLFYFKSTQGTTPNQMMSLDQNDTFRAVHDLFGHAMAGNQFGPKGETNAFLDHVQMFSPLAQKALATETIGQNAWFNFSKDNEGKPVGERHFADQKAFLLDPKLYQPLIERSLHTDAGDKTDDDYYFACPCHRRAEGARADYSPDQSRAANGEFGEGGGEGADHPTEIQRLKAAGGYQMSDPYAAGPVLTTVQQPTELPAEPSKLSITHTSAPEPGHLLSDDECVRLSNDQTATWRDETQGRLDAKEKLAERSWSSEDFRDINTAARANFNDPSAPLHENTKALDTAIAKSTAPENLMLYRGCKTSVFEGAKEGSIFYDGGFLASTADRSFAEQFTSVAGRGFAGNGALVQIMVPKGHEALPVHGRNDHEHEVLLPRGGAYKIVSITKGNGTTPALIKAQAL